MTSRKNKNSEDTTAGVRLEPIRRRIDELDQEILERLNQRAELAIEVGEIKQEQGGEFYVPEREADLVQRLRETNRGPFPEEAIRPVWKEIISASHALEKQLAVSYLGPPGTFTHEACRKQFGFSAQYLPRRTIAEVFDAVEKGKTPYGVVPVENTTEGIVSHTLDLFVDSKLEIVAEVQLQIHHHLMNLSGDAADVRRILTHGQPRAQCREWLARQWPDTPVIDSASTAQAAKEAAADSEAAAIAGRPAAERYGLRLVEERIEDNPHNYTRFLVVGGHRPRRAASSKTSIVFAVKDSVGALYRMLQPFDAGGVNLTKIESRPARGQAWQYVFFVDMAGHVEDEPIAAAVKELEQMCHFVKVLGSYPAADRPA